MTGQTFLEFSFQNANLNGVEMGEARFTGCDFEGASLDNTFYSNTVFEQCTGLDVDRMLDYSCIMCGRKLCKKEDIVIR